MVAEVFRIVNSKGFRPLNRRGEVSVGIDRSSQCFRDAPLRGDLHLADICGIHHCLTDTPPLRPGVAHDRGDDFEPAIRADQRAQLLNRQRSLKVQLALCGLV